MAELPTDTDRRFLSRQRLLVGWGRVGQRIASQLKEQGAPFVVADDQREQVQAMRAAGLAAVWGDPSKPDVLIKTHIRDASALLIMTADHVPLRRTCEVARTLNPTIRILVRCPNANMADLVRNESLGEVFVAEHELASAMIERALARALDPGPDPASPG